MDMKRESSEVDNNGGGERREKGGKRSKKKGNGNDSAAGQNEHPPRRKRLKQSRIAQYAHELNQMPEFYFENGLRKGPVKPYWYIHRTYAKGRWIGRPLGAVFADEFRDQSPEYYVCPSSLMTLTFDQVRAILAGKISVNGARVTPDYLVQNEDLVSHAMHRHEPPITADPLKIVYEDDRILLIAKKKEKAVELMHYLKDRTIYKQYVCRVRGIFPEGTMICEEPILTASHKFSVNVVSAEGKPCYTEFQRISAGKLTSVVLCKPKTGRTHQIRVHLQYLGYPIANDPLYCTDAWGDQLGKEANYSGTTSDVIERLKETCFPIQSAPAVTQVAEQNDESTTYDEASDALEPTAIEGEYLRVRDFPCPECAIKRLEPIPDQLRIFLHSWKYESSDWKFETELPLWAKEDYAGDDDLKERFWNYGGRWDGMAYGNVIQ
ncbi:hypothetical protein HDU96_005000 [Phlyctochytrium bullatum]|nr:hypothetical protein HDU96_005000 [Phlyctochytrium bullatum]